MPNETATTDGAIVVCDKNKNKVGTTTRTGRTRTGTTRGSGGRPYHQWCKRPYYGTVVGGVALGAVLAAGAYAAGPPAPILC